MNQKYVQVLNKEEKGITLIALVITIIVLLILAGVSISMLSGDNGILEQARHATMRSEQGEITEKIKLAAADAMLKGDDYISIEDEDMFKQSLVNQGLPQATVTGDVDTGYIVTIDGKEYNISATGKIEEPGSVTINWKIVEDSDGNNKLSEGDIVAHKERTTEQFYVMRFEENDTKVRLLSKIPVKSDGSEQGYDEYGGPNFSSANYWSNVEGIAYPYKSGENIGKYPDLNNELKYPIGGANSIITTAKNYGSSFDPTGKEITGRLLTVEEVIALGGNIENGTTENCPSYINTHSYWLGSAKTNTDAFMVYGGYTALGWDGFEIGSYYIRPVLDVHILSIEE